MPNRPKMEKGRKVEIMAIKKDSSLYKYRRDHVGRVGFLMNDPKHIGGCWYDDVQIRYDAMHFVLLTGAALKGVKDE